ncbi:hypothetical protein BaRGS_00006350 [Batillaria attramentaria]|uniref:Uncharacterized protein n=1 Tax=Batillaria attramentaria TaxID=370345 RepID=A0ABD0LSH3_9CAEN
MTNRDTRCRRYHQAPPIENNYQHIEDGRGPPRPLHNPLEGCLRSFLTTPKSYNEVRQQQDIKTVRSSVGADGQTLGWSLCVCYLPVTQASAFASLRHKYHLSLQASDTLFLSQLIVETTPDGKNNDTSRIQDSCAARNARGLPGMTVNTYSTFDVHFWLKRLLTYCNFCAFL